MAARATMIWLRIRPSDAKGDEAKPSLCEFLPVFPTTSAAAAEAEPQRRQVHKSQERLVSLCRYTPR